MPVRAGFRVLRHLQTVSILWIVWAVWSVIGWLIALPFVAGVFSHHSPMGPSWPGPDVWGPMSPFAHALWLPGLITLVVVARSVLAVITGIALMRRAPWARTLALVTAFLTLIKPITGTILAIYTLWVLLPARSGQEYEQAQVARV